MLSEQKIVIKLFVGTRALLVDLNLDTIDVSKIHGVLSAMKS